MGVAFRRPRYETTVSAPETRQPLTPTGREVGEVPPSCLADPDRLTQGTEVFQEWSHCLERIERVSKKRCPLNVPVGEKPGHRHLFEPQEF